MTKDHRVSGGKERMSAEIFCDGSYERGQMGIGVYCADPLIEIHKVVTADHQSNNVAECLGAIKALNEAKRLGLSTCRLRSDSQLVVSWCNGRFECKSHTARTYVPQILQLLDECQATICWTPGSKNLADRLSRQHLPSPKQYASVLDRIVGEPMEALGFRDFAGLKCGRDQYSAIRLPNLLEGQSLEVLSGISDFEKGQQAQILRWILRGLPLPKAIRKVKTDLEIAANVRGRHHERSWDDEYPDSQG